MPTLEWIGKDKVVNHHMDVPFRVLEKKYVFGDGGENMIIHGDNLAALKSLLPRFEGRVKCVYIDPPYNTGNEGWCYNDNVSDPKMKKWLGEVVGKEGEDLSRHDKWLCMMYPRLVLLRKLLADDGAIFISIDDNELYNLKLICDEIFGASCFIADISWQRTYSTRNDSKGVVSEVEHVLAYGRKPNWSPNKLPRTEKMNSLYKNPDNDKQSWRNSDAFGPDAATHQGMVYAIQHPFTGKMIYPTISRHWTYDQTQMLEIMRGWCGYELRDIHDEKERAHVCGVAEEEVRRGVMGIVLSDTLEASRAKAQAVYDRGQWPLFFFTKGGKGGIARKTYLEKVGGRLPTNFWPYEETGHTDEAKKELLAIFGGRSAFSTPKPTRLIEFILRIAADKDSLILDSFAGSGTTAHAVLKMNAEDGGSRRFILVEMEDYAENVTAERARRVITGYGESSSATAGTGGGFSYYELGPTLFSDGGELDAGADFAKVREYIWYMETRAPYTPAEDAASPLLGLRGDTAYYIFRGKDGAPRVLDYDLLGEIKERAERYVIYADSCELSAEELAKFGIVFRKIPRDVPSL